MKQTTLLLIITLLLLIVAVSCKKEKLPAVYTVRAITNEGVDAIPYQYEAEPAVFRNDTVFWFVIRESDIHYYLVFRDTSLVAIHASKGWGTNHQYYIKLQ